MNERQATRVRRVVDHARLLTMDNDVAELETERWDRLHAVIAHMLAHGRHDEGECSICDDGRGLVDSWIEAELQRTE